MNPKAGQYGSSDEVRAIYQQAASAVLSQQLGRKAHWHIPASYDGARRSVDVDSKSVSVWPKLAETFAAKKITKDKIYDFLLQSAAFNNYKIPTPNQISGSPKYFVLHKGHESETAISTTVNHVRYLANKFSLVFRSFCSDSNRVFRSFVRTVCELKVAPLFVYSFGKHLLSTEEDLARLHELYYNAAVAQYNTDPEFYNLLSNEIPEIAI